MHVQCRRGEPVQNFQHARVTDKLSGGGHELRVEGVELVWVRIGPEGETGGAADDFKRLVKGAHDVGSTETLILPRDLRNSWLLLLSQVCEDFIHGR